MKLEVREKLNAVFNYPFFRSCGQPLPPTVTKVPNWEIAVRECTSQKWENCRLMARNALQRLSEERDWNRSNQWNPITDELRPVINGFVADLISRNHESKWITEKLKNDLRWDIMFICLEREYQDVVEPLFYLPYLDPWYSSGHLPCGWDGDEFPDFWDGVIRDGRLMVF